MVGCLLLHGFTGSPHEVDPLAFFLQKQTDWRVVCPTLPGHGETPNLRNIRYTEWVTAAEEALSTLMESCDTIYVIGFSMGGMIAAYLSTRYKIDRLVLLSASAYYVALEQTYKDFREMLAQAKHGTVRDHEMYKRYKQKVLHTPITAALQFRKLVRKNRSLLKEIDIPVLIVQGLNDGVVPFTSARFIYDQVSSKDKTVIWLDDCKHLICHCSNNEWLFDQILIFLDKNQMNIHHVF